MHVIAILVIRLLERETTGHVKVRYTDYSTNGFLFPRPLSTFMCQCRRHLDMVIASGSIYPINLFLSLQGP